jgi:hypothetical protein
MDVYSIGATLRAVVDPADDAGLLGEALDGLTAADPADRPTVDRALTLLVRHAGRGGDRPWPSWADGSLPRTPTG